MEHACAQCGAMVEDGRPFCPHCHAPQIRVPVRPPTAPATEVLPPGMPEDRQLLAEPMSDEQGAPPSVGPEHAKGGPNELIWRAAVSSALVAGLLAAVGASIPIIPLAMLCMFASGGLAVTLYRRRVRFGVVSPWMGAKLGMLAGGWGFGLLAILSTFRLFAASERTELRSAFRDKLQQASAAATDPDVHQAMQQFGSYIATDRGLVIVILIFLAIAAIFFLLFAALGGVLGASLFGRQSDGKAS